jgi:hypothetical protein
MFRVFLLLAVVFTFFIHVPEVRAQYRDPFAEKKKASKQPKEKKIKGQPKGKQKKLGKNDDPFATTPKDKYYNKKYSKQQRKKKSGSPGKKKKLHLFRKERAMLDF